MPKRIDSMQKIGPVFPLDDRPGFITALWF